MQINLKTGLLASLAATLIISAAVFYSVYQAAAQGDNAVECRCCLTQRTAPPGQARVTAQEVYAISRGECSNNNLYPVAQALPDEVQSVTWVEPGTNTNVDGVPLSGGTNGRCFVIVNGTGRTCITSGVSHGRDSSTAQRACTQQLGNTGSDQMVAMVCGRLDEGTNAYTNPRFMCRR